MATQTDKPRLTYEDLCRMFPDEDHVRRELIDGELFVAPSASRRHQRVVIRLVVALETQTRDGEVLVAPMDTLFTDYDVVQPDVIWIAPEHADPTVERPLRAGDLVVEVSSPSTKRIDVGRKRDLYERFRVPEYWFLDLDRDQVRIWRLEGDRYGAPVVLDRGDRLSSPLLPGFEAGVHDLLG